MKVPINWLTDYIDVPDEKELMDKLTSIGHMQDGPPVKVGTTNIYDLEVRQNRPDCLSLLGIAREAGAVLNKKVKYPNVDKSVIPDPDRGSRDSQKTTIDIQDPQLCYRFNTVTIENVKVGESPGWLKEKLEAYGIKSINNIVDITNFVMVEFGEPLHAWDATQVKNHEIIVRRAKKGEKTTLLGGRVVDLTPEDLVVADSEKLLTLAGIMGTQDTGVKDDTTSIILEDATYNQAAIRRTSLRHQVRTESSTRHEKFLHPHLAQVGLERATALILELAGGKVVDRTDAYPKKASDVMVTMTLDRLNMLGGVELDEKTALELLKRLELPVKKQDSGIFEVAVPYFRTDLEFEEDLIEEVLRIYGYDKIPSHLPSSPPPQNIDSPDYILEEALRDVLVSAGLDEQITEPLTKEENSKLEPVTLENSLNSDKTMLRTTLKNSLEAGLKNQQKFRKNEIKLFEIGRVYFKDGSNYKEKLILGVATRGVSYFDVKGMYELILDRFDTKLTENDLHIEALDTHEYFFEVSLDKINEAKIVKPLSEPPHVILEDLSLFVPKDVKVGEMIEEMKNVSSLLAHVSLGEEPKVTGDKKSVFLHLEFSSQKKNLTKEDIEPEKNKIIKTLEERFAAKVR